MENAIKKAIEGGKYKCEVASIYKCHNGRYGVVDAGYYTILLDPLFWQALGKQQGWDKIFITKVITKNYLKHWHNFIDHIAVGGSINDFFNNLLK